MKKQLEPTMEHLSDPYVLQLVEALALRDDYVEYLCKRIEELEAIIAADVDRVALGSQAIRIEELEAERDFWKESRDFRVKEHLADKETIERLRAFLDAVNADDWHTANKIRAELQGVESNE